MYAFCIIAIAFLAGVLTSRKILTRGIGVIGVAILGATIILTALSLGGELEQVNFRDSVVSLLLPFMAWASFVLYVHKEDVVRFLRNRTAR